MIKYTLTLALCGFFLLASFAGYAQDHKKKDAYNESVTVIGGYEPTLSDAFKLNENPSIFDTVQRIPVLNYTFNSRQYNLKFLPEAIRPAKVTGEPIARLYRNYAKVGLGTYLSPLAEFYFNTTRSKNTVLGAYVQHYSSWQSLQDCGTSTFANSNVQLFGKYFWLNNFLEANLFYTNNYSHYYGFKPDFAEQVLGFKPDASTYKQSYNRFGLNLSHQSFHIGNHLQHIVNISVADMMDAYGSNQLDVLALADLYKGFDWFGENPQKLGIAFNLDMDRTSIDLNQNVVTNPTPFVVHTKPDIATQAILSLAPYFRFTLAEFNFDLGFKLGLGFAEETKFYFHPAIKVDHSFLHNNLNVYAGLSGGLAKNSLNSLRLINPYITHDIEREISNNRINIYLGAVTKPMKQLDIRTEFMYSNIGNAPIFKLDPRFTLQNVYGVAYDDINRLNILVELAYEYDSHLKFGIGGNYYNVTTDKEPEYWYQPDFDMNIFAKYKIAEKFGITFEGKFVGPTTGFYYNTVGDKVTDDLQGRFDMSIAFDYYYNKSLRFFWLLNNVASQRYYEWTNYPTQKFNTMLGLSYSF